MRGLRASIAGVMRPCSGTPTSSSALGTGMRRLACGTSYCDRGKRRRNLKLHVSEGAYLSANANTGFLAALAIMLSW